MAIGDGVNYLNEVGALTGLPVNPEEETEEDALYKFNVYQNLASQAPDLGGRKLQDVYGTSALPMYEWVSRIKTGEKTFDPASQFDNNMLEQYKQNLAQTGQQETSPTMMDLVKGVVPAVGGIVGDKLGRAFADPLLTGATAGKVTAGDSFMAAGKSLLPSFMNEEKLPSSVASDLSRDLMSDGYLEKLGSGENLFTGDTALLKNAGIKYTPLTYGTGKDAVKVAVVSNNDATKIASGLGADKILSPDEGYLGQLGQNLTSKESLAGTAGSFGLSFGLDLIMGKDPVEAAKSAAGAAVGGTIGSAVGGPIGGFIGATVGKLVTGGRVICNELNRQGLMSKRQVVLDYKFTRDYLSPKHVNGYHVWAVFVVKQMREGKFVNFWKHIATHRANEIAYIYGERDKPDYLGKIYRHIGEPICWLLGVFSDSSDWSTLYNSKEI